jgi:hypothetical protein
MRQQYRNVTTGHRRHTSSAPVTYMTRYIATAICKTCCCPRPGSSDGPGSLVSITSMSTHVNSNHVVDGCDRLWLHRCFAIILDSIINPEISITILDSRLYQHSQAEKLCETRATRAARSTSCGKPVSAPGTCRPHVGHAPSSSSHKTGQHCHSGTGLVGWCEAQLPPIFTYGPSH